MSESAKCGIGRFRFQSLQCCATILCFTGIYSLSSLTTSTLSIYISSQITTLERQFGFSSAQSGFILSCNDVGFLAVTLFISYRATSAHIPRTLGISTILYGVAGILCSLAYFLHPSSSNEVGQKNESVFHQREMPDLQLCTRDVNRSILNENQCKEGKLEKVGTASSFTPVALFIIALGMALQGLGKSPRTPFVSYYIDENVDKTKTSMYLGTIMAVGIFGPALAFGLGAFFTNMYVTLEDVDITPKDPRWIGAWWLGFLIFGIVSIIFALPLFCFPKRYKRKDVKDDLESRTNVTFKHHIKGFLATVVRLFRNGCFTFSCLGSCAQMFFVAGMVSFLPKFLETQFTIPAWHANLLMGALNVTSASIGTLIGAYIVYRFRLSPYSCIRLSVCIVVITSFVPVLGFFIGCNNPDIVGYNVQSDTNVSVCMENCNCDQDNFFPVCGSDNRNYFSYCHAGCTGRNKQIFIDCECIGQNATATPGLCTPDCQMLYVYLSVVFLFAMTMTVTIMPEYIFVMRCVHDKDKAMAVAFRTLLVTLLGWFPGPVVVGKVVDTCCRLWNTNCGEKGSCSLYDLVDFRYRRHALDLGVRLFAVLMYILAFLCARRRTDLKSAPKLDLEKPIVPEGETLISFKANGENNCVTEKSDSGVGN